MSDTAKPAEKAPADKAAQEAAAKAAMEAAEKAEERRAALLARGLDAGAYGAAPPTA